MTAPVLRWTSTPARADAVVLVLHGGYVTNLATTRWWQTPVLRMLPFAWALRAAGGRHLAVARLRYAARGWNEAGAPVQDARWALGQVRERYPGLPIGLLGHSMGGRVSLQLASEPDVMALVVLATWLEDSDPVHGHPGLRALLMHGDRDELTDPRGSEVAAARLTAQGARVVHTVVEGEAHPMLRRPAYWHRTATRFLLRALLGR